MSELKTKLLTAVAAVRAQGIVVVKTARNTGINSDYASYADVWAALAPKLSDVGLSVGFLPGDVRKDSEAWVQSLQMEIVCETETIVVPFQVLFPEGNRGVNLTQRQGMAHTYGKRYALVDYFHLITGDDDDAVRLGQPSRADEAPRADKSAHWRQFCHVELFGVGTAETAGTWGMLADPSDDSGERILGDLQGGAMAKLWTRFPDNPGINAWRAELIGDRAKAKMIQTWDECVTTYKTLHLPPTFAECNGEHLSNLALALK
jgi:hypothetical protein